MVGIYKITNTQNGKVYIGQSRNIEQRWKAHRTRPYQQNREQYNSPFYRAIRKYGLSNFSFEVIEECLPEELNQQEIYWISIYDSTNPIKGYNLTKGGSNPSEHTILTIDQVKNIQELLQKSNMTEQNIADKFGISQRMVSGINLGQNWIDINLVYPLRKKPEKIKHYCKKCGSEISRGATHCIECSKIEARKQKRPSREELKILIREKTFVELGQMFSVSDNAIRKWCKAYNLPHQKKVIKQFTEQDWSQI